jgi:hypothetical protein
MISLRGGDMDLDKARPASLNREHRAKEYRPSRARPNEELTTTEGSEEGDDRSRGPKEIVIAQSRQSGPAGHHLAALQNGVKTQGSLLKLVQGRGADTDSANSSLD